MESISRKERKENSCFNYEKRRLLEGYLLGKQGYPKIKKRSQLAGIFGCDRKTIYNEIKRGLVEHTRSDLSTVWKYNADYAQLDADWENTSRGRAIFPTDMALLKALYLATKKITEKWTMPQIGWGKIIKELK
ncbi:MAG: hypothetical protein GX220_06385, partial [Treponema sp.]|nr:hypothetical protein [Treponema sp.]